MRQSKCRAVATMIFKKTQICGTGISSSKILCSVIFYNLVAWTNISFKVWFS